MEARAAPERELTSWHGGMVKGGHGKPLLQVSNGARGSKHPPAGFDPDAFPMQAAPIYWLKVRLMFVMELPAKLSD